MSDDQSPSLGGQESDNSAGLPSENKNAHRIRKELKFNIQHHTIYGRTLVSIPARRMLDLQLRHALDYMKRNAHD